MRTSTLVIVAATLPLLAAARHAEPPKPQPRSAAPHQISPERLNQLRQSLTAQIAVYDAGENAMRAPTVAESATLANPASGAAQEVVQLPTGGVALRADASHASFAKAVVQADGTVKVMFGDKGGRDDR
jgi:hypothetical protein